MSSPGTDRRDFFISFNSANRAWAEWIASELETAGYTTYFQHWDFAPGSNFVIEMHKAAAQSDRTIAVLSPAYLTALFTQPEWAAALMQDPAGAKRTLVPVRVEECSPEGILAPIVYADLVGLDEGAARAKLLATAQGRRPTPASVAFPKGGSAPKREFPRVAVVEQKAPPGLEPSPEPHRDVRVPPSFLWFGLALLAAVLLIAFGNRLVGLGLVNQIHYVLLVALGLAAAVAMRRSLARYRGKSKLGDLELRGPVVVLALVIGAGMWFAPGSGSFGVTVFVEGPEGPLRQGRVALDLGPDRRVEAIGEKGAAFFSGIPAEFRGREAGVSLEANGFERTEGGPVKLANDSVYVKVRKRAIRLHGVVLDEDAEPIASGTVDLEGRSEPIQNGRFDFLVPGDLVKNETVTVDIRSAGHVSQTHQLVPHSQEFRTKLIRRASK